ncbi:sugar ABC transporter substrate-binding protein [Streptomyces sp. SBT349]|uniref:sugar ABC transporter substrate-binding protein n=1 Tax=Streptomyces sp. SBT349 TaxID=1580539 RepID=UPI00066BA884|nr:extracellular solute-binding protein [Streptomyces sp. SBT349]
MHTRRTLSAAACGMALLAATACSSSFGEDEDTPQEESEGPQSLTILIATSGEAETAAVEAAAAAYEEESGNTVTVEVAQDMNQQLGQAFAGGEPPDVFYVDSSQFANYAEGGSLYPYGEQISDVGDFSPTLSRSFTHDGELVCVPKDTSSLGLVVNTGLWQEAGLTEDDYPTTWAELESVAAELTAGDVTGLVTSNEYQRLGAFMKQAGGWVTDPEQTEVTADSPENAEALEFVRGMLTEGSLKYAADMDAGWAGEAFGEGRAAMTIEGSWLAGAMEADYPDVAYAVLPLPEGPAGPGTLAFTNCWGVAQDSGHRETAVELVEFLTRAEQQIAMGDAFGAIPSRQSAAEDYLADHPEDEAWGASGDWVQGPVTLRGFDRVLAQFNTDLESLRTGDPGAMLSDLQRYGEAALEENR